jgi:hypothetical protein
MAARAEQDSQKKKLKIVKSKGVAQQLLKMESFKSESSSEEEVGDEKAPQFK